MADDLAYRYALALGYDTTAESDLASTFDAVGTARRGRLPEWLSVHPSPSKRPPPLDPMLVAINTGGWEPRVRGSERYMQHIDGMVFGEDPRRGYLRGSTFVQPELRYQIDFPARWRIACVRSSCTGLR